eukprot:TRINITY_DN102_c0_g1_i1.p1 TRINITY_DN102_c0_g1~~TRINITY_DN102_c0_g1_i1.p1  ORF type:complete len:1096 (+),score=215.02 TRINITY_DN102_c0_g1_i1:29-3289(+)
MSDFLRRLSSFRLLQTSTLSPNAPNTLTPLQSPFGEEENSPSSAQSSPSAQSSHGVFSARLRGMERVEIKKFAMACVIDNDAVALQETIDTKVFAIDELFGGRVKRTLLHCASSFGSKDCLEVLLRNGSNINVLDSVGNTALHLGAQSGCKESVRYLIERGADIYIGNRDGFIALHWLAANGYHELLKYFLDKTKCDPNLPDRLQRSPLHLACQNGHKDTVLCLLRYGSDPLKQDSRGRAPLFSACVYGQLECVKVLLDHDIPISASPGGDHPMELAVRSGSKKVCYLLLSRQPSLVHQLVQQTNNHNLDISQLVSIFEYICSEQPKVDFPTVTGVRQFLTTFGSSSHTPPADLSDLGQRIIECLENHVSMTGQRLLSHTSDMPTERKVFINQIEILSKILYRDKRLSGMRSSGNHSAAQFVETKPTPTASNSYTIFGSPSAKVDSIQSLSEAKCSSDAAQSLDTRSALESLWEALDAWLQLLGSSSEYDGNKDPLLNSTAFDRSSALDKFLVDQKYHNEVPEVGTQTVPAVESDNIDVNKDGDVVHENPIFSESTEDVAGPSEKKPILGFLHPVRIQMQEHNHAPVQPNAVHQDELLSHYIEKISAIIHGFHLYCSATESARRGDLQSRNSAPKRILSKKKQLSSRFRDFVQKHIDVLRKIIRHQPKILFDHFHFLFNHHSVMNLFMDLVRTQPFELRKEWFYENLGKFLREEFPVKPEDQQRFEDPFSIDRGNPFEASCGLFADAMKHDAESILISQLSVQFDGEAGVGPGVRREWFDLMSKEIVNPNYGLFIPSADGGTVQPNPNSGVNPDHLAYLKFAGWIVALAIIHRELLDVYFTRSFYKHILGAPITLDDLASIDPEYHKSLMWIMENNIDECGLEIPFSIDYDSFGELQQVELIPNGTNVMVTESNKGEYVHMAAEFKMTAAIGMQLSAFLEGFERFIPHSLICMFDEYELEILISGSPDICIKDWRNNTGYSGIEANDELVQWFWEVVAEMLPNERVLLLQFVTGSARVPHGGFSGLIGAAGPTSFTLSLAPGESSRLPTASTCFNLLKIPRYNSKATLKQRLMTALHCGSRGFEFA